jgi:hypothetical protein
MAVLPGPLHRLTRLKDDPAQLWLGGLDRIIVLIKGWAVWLLYLIFLRVVFLSFHFVISTASGDYNLAQSVGIGIGRALSIPGLLTAGVGALLLIPMRRVIVSTRASTIAKMARQAGESAAPIDDVSLLGAEPDGRVVSLVGWVRGHGYVDIPVAGQPAVGLTLRCQDGMPFVLESIHNFDLVDEAGNEALVLTGDGRLFGDANVRLSRATENDRQLIMSLNLPPSVVPTDWNALAVRDGDPVMVIGTKTTVQDYTQIQKNRSVARTAVASSKERPLLMFPLDAERRNV